MKYKNIFFDFDGTLFDTIVPITIAINNTMKHFCIDRKYDENQTKYFIGSGTPTAVKRALNGLKYNKDYFQNVVDFYLNEQKKTHLKICNCFKGVKSTLEYLKRKKVKCFIVTNKPEILCKKIVKKELPSFFTEIVSNDGRFDFKPCPDGGNYLIEKYKINKSEVLFVGDSKVDFQTAKNLGVDFGLCTYGYEDYSRIKIRNNDFLLTKFPDIKNI